MRRAVRVILENLVLRVDTLKEDGGTARFALTLVNWSLANAKKSFHDTFARHLYTDAVEKPPHGNVFTIFESKLLCFHCQFFSAIAIPGLTETQLLALLQ